MRAIVLSGGGGKGVFQCGVLKSLLENDPNLDYDIYAGVSVGALNAALLATGPLKKSLPELENLWLKKIKGSHSIWSHHLWHYILAGIFLILFFVVLAFLSFILSAHKLVTILFVLLALGSFYAPYYSLMNTHSVYTTEPLKELVNETLDIEKLQSSNKILRIGAVNFNTGKYGTGTENDSNIKNWIFASSSFPIFFPMEKIGEHYWTDGGVTEIAPLSDVIKLGATEIDIIITSPLSVNSYVGQPGLPKQLLRNLDIISSETLRNDIHARCHQDGVKVRIFMPKENLTDNALSFHPDKIRSMYEIGIKLGEEQLAENEDDHSSKKLHD